MLYKEKGSSCHVTVSVVDDNGRFSQTNSISLRSLFRRMWKKSGLLCRLRSFDAHSLRWILRMLHSRSLILSPNWCRPVVQNLSPRWPYTDVPPTRCCLHELLRLSVYPPLHITSWQAIYYVLHGPKVTPDFSALEMLVGLYHLAGYDGAV